MEHSFPLVSVVITTYNSAEYIEQALASAVGQTYKNIEIILVDDCSTDNTLVIAERFLSKFKKDINVEIISRSVNAGGPAKPRNMAISLARGRFVAFLDGDDVWCRYKLAIQVKLLIDSHVSSEICFSGYECIDELHVNAHELTPEDTHNFKEFLFKSLWVRSPLCFSSVVISLDLLKEIQFDQDEALHGVEDYYLWLRLYSRGCEKAIIAEQNLVGYRISNSNSLSREKFRQNVRSIYALARIFLLQDKKIINRRFFIFGVFLRFVRMGML